MYSKRHSHSYVRRFRKPTPFLESLFGQVLCAAALVFAFLSLAWLLFLFA